MAVPIVVTITRAFARSVRAIVTPCSGCALQPRSSTELRNSCFIRLSRWLSAHRDQTQAALRPLTIERFQKRNEPIEDLRLRGWQCVSFEDVRVQPPGEFRGAV